MITYISAFIFYTLAMVGILLAGFVIYKKFMLNQNITSKSTIKIVDSCPIGAKKTLLVVKIKNEKFLIASGAEHTTFLAKLENTANSNYQETVFENNAQSNVNIEKLLETVKEMGVKKVQNEIKFTQPRNEITINDVEKEEPREPQIDELKLARAQKLLNLQKKQQKQQKLQELQKQFMDLYNENNDEDINDNVNNQTFKQNQANNNRKILNKILQELNSSNNMTSRIGK